METQTLKSGNRTAPAKKTVLTSVFGDYPVPEDVRQAVSDFLRQSSRLEVEIGCGKGKFLFTHAEKNPDISFLGIDRVGKWMKRRLKRAAEQNLRNFLFVKADAVTLLKKVFPFACVDVFHIYFPDPWPKRKHRKRRLINPALLQMLFQKLKSGGLVYIATDDQNYHEEIKTGLAENPIWKVRESVNLRLNPNPEIQTNYELKFQAAGKPLYYLELTKHENC